MDVGSHEPVLGDSRIRASKQSIALNEPMIDGIRQGHPNARRRPSRGGLMLTFLLAVLSKVGIAAPGFCQSDTEAHVPGTGHTTDGAKHRTSASRIAEAMTPVEAYGYARLTAPFAEIAMKVYRDYEPGSPVESTPVAPGPGGLTHDEAGGQTVGLIQVEPTPFSRYNWEQLDVRLTDGFFDRAEKVGLNVQVFLRQRDDDRNLPAMILFGFRGTNFCSAHDWDANLRWVTQVVPHEDQYRLLHAYVRQLIDAARAAARDRYPDVTFEIFATGHSLGGGLAQLFAYTSQDVKGVVAFDASPVTGYHSVVTDAEVNCNASILRVYERGEVLSYARLFIRLFYNLSPNIEEVGFHLIGGNPIVNHSMRRFYEGLTDLEQNATWVAPWEHPQDGDCIAKRKQGSRASGITSAYIAERDTAHDFPQ
jgi:hypothetical protein